MVEILENRRGRIKMVKVTMEYSLVIRRKSLTDKNISLEQINEVFEGNAPLDINEELISYGPHFGQERMMYYFRRSNIL